MMMKKAITFFLLAGLLYLGSQPLSSQEKKKAAKKDVKKAVKKEIPPEPPIKKPRLPYDPVGRRDHVFGDHRVDFPGHDGGARLK